MNLMILFQVCMILMFPEFCIHTWMAAMFVYCPPVSVTCAVDVTDSRCWFSPSPSPCHSLRPSFSLYKAICPSLCGI